MPSWIENKPQSGDQVRELGGLARDQKTVIDNAMQKHFYWGDSTDSAGVPRFSTATGAFRTFWGVASALSSTADTGSLMIAADGNSNFGAGSYSTLHSVGADGVVPLSSNAVIVRDAAGGAGANNTRYIVDSGVDQNGTAPGPYNTDFNITFDAVPQVEITSMDTRYFISVTAINASGFSSDASLLVAVDPSTADFHWRAWGIVTL